MPRRILLAASIALLAACGNDRTNPFAGYTTTKPPSADTALLLVSGSWSAEPGAPRELLGLSADGSKIEQLTFCAQAPQPCDFVEVAPSSDRNRLMAVRTTPGAEEGADALYFMDLSRSVETIILPNRRVPSADYSFDGSFVVFSSIPSQTAPQEDLFLCLRDGTQEQNLTSSSDARELNPRIDPFGRTAVFERIDETGVSRVYLYAQTPLTSGPATGGALPGTPYVVGADAHPAFSPDGLSVVFCRLTGTGNGGLGTWDLLTLRADGASTPQVVATGPVYRGAPDWGSRGIVFVETDAATAHSQLVLIQADGSGRTVLRTEDASRLMGSPRWLAGS